MMRSRELRILLAALVFLAVPVLSSWLLTGLDPVALVRAMVSGDNVGAAAERVQVDDRLVASVPGGRDGFQIIQMHYHIETEAGDEEAVREALPRYRTDLIGMLADADLDGRDPGGSISGMQERMLGMARDAFQGNAVHGVGVSTVEVNERAQSR